MSQLAVFPPAQGVRCHVPSKCHHCLLLATPGGSNVSVLIFQGRTEAPRTKAAHPGLCRSWSSDLCTSPCGCSLAVTCRSHNQQLQALGSPWPLVQWLAEVLSPRGPGQISLGDGSWSERCVPPGPGRQRQCMRKGRPVRRHWRLSLLVSRKAGLLSLSKQGAQIQLLLDRDSRRAWSSELLCRWPGLRGKPPGCLQLTYLRRPTKARGVELRGASGRVKGEKKLAIQKGRHVLPSHTTSLGMQPF